MVFGFRRFVKEKILFYISGESMDNFQKEFVMSLFMDTDSVNTNNRIAVAVADVINENNENLCRYNEVVREEFGDEPLVEFTARASSRTLVRCKDYYEKEVQSFSNEDYEATFGMKRSTVNALIQFLTSVEQPRTIPMDKKVHVFIMFLMSDLSYNDVGKLFGLHKSSVCHIFHEIAYLLANNLHTYISWPSVEDQHLTRIKVNSRFKIPNCVGFIDVCRFNIGEKRNKRDTILLQAVCDESLQFMDIHIGEVAKTKKNKVFRDSPLAHELQNFVEYENHLLGDSDYKMQMNLITPFTCEELLTIEEMKFNEAHWKALSYYIHAAFEMLKSKMCKLNYLESFKSDFINTLIYSACVLHNFIIMHEGSLSVKEENIICDDGVEMNNDVVQTPEEKRQFLCNYINFIDSDLETIPSR